MVERAVTGIKKRVADASNRQICKNQQFPGDGEAHVITYQVETLTNFSQMPGQRSGLDSEFPTYRRHVASTSHEAGANEVSQASGKIVHVAPDYPANLVEKAQPALWIGSRDWRFESVGGQDEAGMILIKRKRRSKELAIVFNIFRSFHVEVNFAGLGPPIGQRTDHIGPDGKGQIINLPPTRRGMAVDAVAKSEVVAEFTQVDSGSAGIR